MLDRAEYWLLDVVVAGYLPLGSLAREPASSPYNRALGHLLDYPHLLDTLHLMFQRGDLIASQTDTKTNESVLFVPTMEQLDIALTYDLLDYGVTPQGGALWEQYSDPQWDLRLGETLLDIEEWNRYDAAARQLEGVTVRTPSAINRNLVEEYVTLEMQQGTVIGSPEWRSLTPYHATYWKTFPHGYQAVFLYKEKAVWVTDKEVMLNYQFHEFLERSFHWYTNPFGHMFLPLGMDSATLSALRRHERRRLRRTRPHRIHTVTPLFPNINGVATDSGGTNLY